MLSQQFPNTFNFMVFAIPGVVAAVAVFLISNHGRRDTGAVQALAGSVD
ncbi:hypothetical protein PO002_38770 [Cupriavidus necator]